MKPIGRATYGGYEHNEPARGPHTHTLTAFELALELARNPGSIQNRTSKSQCCGVKWAWVFSVLRGRGGGFTVRRCSHDSGLEHGLPTSRSAFSSSAMTLSGHPLSAGFVSMHFGRKLF